jgi:hypothetical protein
MAFGRVEGASPRGRIPEGETPMESSHVSALQLKHAGLERRLSEEQNRPMPDPVTIQLIKKRKLRIKEELAHI